MTEQKARLVVVSPRGHEQTYFLTGDPLTIGRGAVCDVPLNDPKASRRHARLERDGEEWRLVDLGSRHGLWKGDERVESLVLSAGEGIQVGDHLIYLHDPRAPDSRANQEYVEIVAGEEPTLFGSMAPAAEATITENGVERSLNDTSSPRLVVHVPGRTRERPLLSPEVTIGRQGCSIVIDDPAASRLHAVIERRGDRFWLRDLGSKNGTWLGEKRVGEEPLANGANFRIGGTFFVFKDAVSPSDPTLAGMAPTGERAPSGRRPVVVIPGIMGSELWLGEQMVWPDLMGVLRNPELLAFPDRGLEARAIARQVVVVPHLIKLEAYSRLVQFLVEGLGYTPGVDLLEFPYDWRQDNRLSAAKLEEAVARWRAETLGSSTKITILAHSMGSLVSRYFLECLGGAEEVERLVLLGAPCFGSPFMVRALLQGPKLLPLGIGNETLHRALVTLPACYQLVPIYPCVFTPDGEPVDHHQEAGWVATEHRHLLQDAREFHRELGDRVSVPVTCIFGYGVKTITHAEVDDTGPEGWRKVRFMIEAEGDNRVVDRWAYMEGADLHPVRQYHGALWTDDDVKMRIKLELER